MLMVVFLDSLADRPRQLLSARAMEKHTLVERSRWNFHDARNTAILCTEEDDLETIAVPDCNRRGAHLCNKAVGATSFEVLCLHDWLQLSGIAKMDITLAIREVRPENHVLQQITPSTFVCKTNSCIDVLSDDSVSSVEQSGDENIGSGDGVLQ